jgi:hypothetical protein
MSIDIELIAGDALEEIAAYLLDEDAPDEIKDGLVALSSILDALIQGVTASGEDFVMTAPMPVTIIERYTGEAE